MSLSDPLDVDRGPAAGPHGSGSPRSRLARAVRLLLVGVVLCAEFSFVMWVFHLDDPVAEQRAAVEGVAALAALPGPAAGEPVPASWRETLERCVEDLVAADVPGAEQVGRAAAGEDRAALRSAIADSRGLVLDEQRATDRLVVLIMVTLFLVVCVGWFVWFNRLARRHRAAQRELTERQVAEVGERRLRALVEHGSDLVLVLDRTSRITFASPASLSVLGRDPADLRRFIDLVAEQDQSVVAHLLGRADGREQSLTLRLRHADGREIVAEGTLKDLHHDEAVRGWVLTVRDVTEQRALEASLTHQAFHDSLTGLANRQLFADRLHHALARREATGAPLSVLFIDLDDFKLVNDSLGHQAGDDLLVAVAARAVEVLRPEDTAARLGGDEFAILLEDTPPRRATKVAELLLEALGSAFPGHLGGHRHVVEASVGVAGIEDGGPPAEDLMRDADLAMYVAKERGKGCVAVYDAALHARAMELLELRTALAEAIREGQLVLHYQPTVDLRSQTVSGFEALVRWEHPTRGLLFPGDFIAEAERSGLVVPMGEWVLREACRAAVGMQVDGVGPSMAVNVAAAQLAQPDFSETVLDALRTSGLPAHRLVLEITETAVVDDIEASVVLLGGLREHGVRVAIDDFGTGYNSLSSLAALPADVLKVDKSFVDRLGGAEADSSLVEAILAMSSALSLVTVAEGVEDADQARWLHQHAASTGQGYLWSRPVPLEAALGLLRDGLPQVSDIGGGLRLVPDVDETAPGSAIA